MMPRRPSHNPTATRMTIGKLHFGADDEMDISLSMPIDLKGRMQQFAELRLEWCEELQRLLVIVDSGDVTVRVERGGKNNDVICVPVSGVLVGADEE